MLSADVNVMNASDCLCVIDVQTQFLGSCIEGASDQIKFVKNIESLALNYDLVIGVEFDIGDGYAGDEILYGIERISDKVIVKSTPDTFECEEFTEFLDDCEVASIDFVGIETNCCVLQSFLTAVDDGYDCRVIEDLCASSSKKSHDLALAIMRSYEKDLKGVA